MSEVLVICAFAGLVYYAFSRGGKERSSKFTFAVGEEKIAELYVKTRDLRFGGFFILGSPNEGKLVLTTERLLYCRSDQKRVAIQLRPPDIHEVRIEHRGIIVKTPAIVVLYSRLNDGNSNTQKITWSVASSSGGLISHSNYHTAESFTNLLESWKDGNGPTMERETRARNAYVGKKVVSEHLDQAVRELLNSDETLLGIFHGQALSAEEYGPLARSKGGISLHDYLLVTNSRIIMWARGLMSASTDVFYFEDISSVEEARGPLLGELVFNVRGAKERMRNMVVEDVPKAAQMIREQVAAHKRANQGMKPAESTADTLKKLGELRNSGVLTEEEFNAKKTELLKRL